MARKKFEAPEAPNAVTTAYTETQPQTRQFEQEKTFYRFNAKLPVEYKAFLQEMAWRYRIPINDFLVKIVGEYMDAHPEWKKTIDTLNV